jgi:hypothetical protein
MFDFRHVAEQTKRSASTRKPFGVIDMKTMYDGARKFG